MTPFVTVLLAALTIATAFMQGCVPALWDSRSGSESEPGPRVRTLPPASDSATGQAPEASVTGQSPREKPPPVPKQALPASPRESLERDNINRAALEFAMGIPDVQHVKTCFSKVFGGWYLHLYLKKGKTVSLEHYTWNPISGEWEVSLAVKELPIDNLENHLKSEVGDERCTVLK